jgi:Zn-dependent protease with chaperone function
MIGGGIFLVVVGAIVRYALNVNIGGIEEGTLGLILIVAGIVMVVLGLIAAPFQLWLERRRTVAVDDPDARYRSRTR